MPYLLSFRARGREREEANEDRCKPNFATTVYVAFDVALHYGGSDDSLTVPERGLHAKRSIA